MSAEGVFDPEVYGEPVYTDNQSDTETYGELGDDVSAITAGYGQAQAQIIVFGVQRYSQALGLIPNWFFGQAQAKIVGASRAYGQAQGNIADHTRTTQVSAEVVETSTNQTGRITQNLVEVIELSTDLKARTTQSLVEVVILVFTQGYGQANALIDSPHKQAFGQANAGIIRSIAYGQAQASVVRTQQAYAQAQACIKGNAFGQAQADIKTTYRAYAQAQASILATYQVYAQAQGDIKSPAYGFGQAQATIRGNAYGQAQAKIYIAQVLYPIADITTLDWEGVVI